MTNNKAGDSLYHSSKRARDDPIEGLPKNLWVTLRLFSAELRDRLDQGPLSPGRLKVLAANPLAPFVEAP